MRSPIRLLLCGLILLAGLRGPASEFAAYRQVAVAAHLHTRFSDGAERMSRVVEMARGAGFQAVWLTDHADTYWELPVLGTTVGYFHHSLHETGFDAYLQACRRVQARYPDMILIPGFEASPYYFWSGHLLGGKLVNHQWRKHLIVAGIEDARTFRRLPMLAYNASRPGFTDEGEAPYLHFTEAVRAAGGVAFWAHPYGSEVRHMALNVFSAVTAYTESLLTAPVSNGMATGSAGNIVTAPGGVWDRALAAYVAGERPVLPGTMVEIDYHQGKFPVRPTLVLLTTPADTPDAQRVACLEALKAGRYYVTNAVPGKLTLADFTLTAPSGERAVPGESLPSTGPLTISYSLMGENPIQWVKIIRNGAVAFEQAGPSGTWTAPQESPTGTSGYFRLVAQDSRGQFLLSQPIIVRAPGP